MEQAELYANMPENAIGAYTGVEQLDPAITEAEKDLFKPVGGIKIAHI